MTSDPYNSAVAGLSVTPQTAAPANARTMHAPPLRIRLRRKSATDPRLTARESSTKADTVIAPIRMVGTRIQLLATTKAPTKSRCWRELFHASATGGRLSAAWYPSALTMKERCSKPGARACAKAVPVRSRWRRSCAATAEMTSGRPMARPSATVAVSRHARATRTRQPPSRALDDQAGRVRRHALAAEQPPSASVTPSTSPRALGPTTSSMDRCDGHSLRGPTRVRPRCSERRRAPASALDCSHEQPRPSSAVG